MGQLVSIEKIFPFTEEEINQIKNAGETPIENIWFPYSEIVPSDLDDFYVKDNPADNKLVFVSCIGNPHHWNWMLTDRIQHDMYEYGFCDNATQARLYAEKIMKNDPRDYCIALVPFKASNDYYEKFYWANGPYIGEMPHEEPEMNYETLEDITIPERVKILFHFYIIFPKQENENVK